VQAAGAPRRPVSVPLVVGVTGHRDLLAEDAERLGACLEGLLGEIAAQVQHTPLVLLSALAAGADILAAEVALRRGIAVVALLPMPVAAYRADFDDDVGRRFDAVLERCALVQVVGRAPHDLGEREACYAVSDAYLARHSNYLIALWDGVEGAKAAGTAAVVRMRLHGSPTNTSALLEPLDTGSVYRIVTRRRSKPSVDGPFRIERLYPDEERAEGDAGAAERAASERLDVLNGDLASGGIAPGEDGSEAVVLRAVDAAANSLQRRSVAVERALYILAFVAASAQVVLKDDTWSTFVKIALLAVALVVLLYARRARVDSRYEDYRALAEGLRVADAWRGAGLKASVDRYYLRMQAGELQWIRRALRSVALLETSGAVADPKPALARWIAGQETYYGRAAARERTRQSRCDALAFVLTSLNLFASIVVAALLVVPFPPVRAFVATQREVMHGILPLFIAWAALSAGLLWSYANERRFGESARRYARMHLLFARARRQLERTADPEELALELGRESLAEHADWLLTRRARPVSVFKN
jgi:hypothetical protein